MRIAFYAPLKAPTHPVPSGDRLMARNLMHALGGAGHEVALASRLRSYDRDGDYHRQRRIRTVARRLGDRLLGRYSATKPPDLWFTYHPYHKAPDWLGPRIAQALAIPYVVAEASVSERQRTGPWALGFRATERAVMAANRIICLNPADEPALRAMPRLAERMRGIAPWLDLGARRSDSERDAIRAELGRALDLDPGAPWIACVAMMRDDAKLRSYRLLAMALAEVQDVPWTLLVVGDGIARERVADTLSALTPGRVVFAGKLPPDEVVPLLAACEVFAWPAYREAWGMTVLEAAAAAIPVVIGRNRGTAAIVEHRGTGLLVDGLRENDPGSAWEGAFARAFAAAVREILADAGLRRRLGHAARENAEHKHSLGHARAVLESILRPFETKRDSGRDSHEPAGHQGG